MTVPAGARTKRGFPAARRVWSPAEGTSAVWLGALCLAPRPGPSGSLRRVRVVAASLSRPRSPESALPRLRGAAVSGILELRLEPGGAGRSAGTGLPHWLGRFWRAPYPRSLLAGARGGSPKSPVVADWRPRGRRCVGLCPAPDCREAGRNAHPLDRGPAAIGGGGGAHTGLQEKVAKSWPPVK